MEELLQNFTDGYNFLGLVYDINILKNINKFIVALLFSFFSSTQYPG